MKHEKLREKCEKVFMDVVLWRDAGKPYSALDTLEAFASEIRNEALEEACACFQDEHEHVPSDFIVQRIRALKDSK